MPLSAIFDWPPDWSSLGKTGVAFVVVLWLASRILRRLRGALDRRYRARISDVQFHSFEIVRAEQLWHALHRAINVLAAVIGLVAVYLYLNYVLLLFPWTRGLGHNLFAILLQVKLRRLAIHTQHHHARVQIIA